MEWLFLLVLLAPIAGYLGERQAYNHGICKRCKNSFLTYFDTDSQGGKGYTCYKCDYTTWVSYPWIIKK